MALFFPQVASALHDNCRAVLVGEKTFGKVKILALIVLPSFYSISLFVHFYKCDCLIYDLITW